MAAHAAYASETAAYLAALHQWQHEVVRLTLADVWHELANLAERLDALEVPA